MRHTVWISLFSFCSFALGAQTHPPISQMGLNQAIEYAVQNAPILKAFSADVEKAKAEKRKALAGFFPQVDLQADQGLSSGSTQRLGSLLGVQVTENLFDSGISLLKYDSAALTKRATELAFQNARDQLALSVAQEFSKYSLNKNLLEVQKTQYETVKKQQENMETLYRQGVKTRKDYLRFTSERRRNEIDVVNAEMGMQRAAVEIRRILGMMGNEPELQFSTLEVEAQMDNKIPAHPPDISRHFRFQIVELQLEALENNVSIEERKFWPQLYLSSAWNYTQDDYLKTGRGFAGFTGNNWNFWATLKLNIMDWGIRRKNIEIASQERIVQESRFKDSLNIFSADNKKLMIQIQQSSTNYKLSKELLEIETKTYDLLKTEYQNGKVTYLDLIVGLRDLLAAKVKLFSSYFDLQQLLYQYRYHEGRMYASIQEA